jgi:hypothetical protein
VHGNRAAQLQPGRTERLIRRESLSTEVRRGFSQELSDLVVDFAVRCFPVEERPQAATDLAP